jgi:hypothetical protein
MCVFLKKNWIDGFFIFNQCKKFVRGKERNDNKIEGKLFN